MATNLSLKYTDEQLNEALARATAQVGGLSIEGFSDETEWHPDEIDHLRAILDHLPDHQDDWQECTFEEIRKGDRVKRVLTRPGGSIVIKEGVAHLLDGQIWDTQDGVCLASPHHIPASEGSVDTYRIPAPVQHPDPEVDRVVVMHGWTRGYTEQCKPTKSIAMLYDGANYVGYDDGSGERLSLAPENITDWTPVDVVPKVVADE